MSSTSSKFPIDKYKNYFDSEGWGLRVRKPGKRISQGCEEFHRVSSITKFFQIEFIVITVYYALLYRTIWLQGTQNGRKIQPDAIREKIRTERNEREISNYCTARIFVFSPFSRNYLLRKNMYQQHRFDTKLNN